MSKKVSRWDLKNALKLVGLDPSDENVEKLNEFRGVDEELKTELTEPENKGNLVSVGIVQIGAEFLIVKVPFKMEDAEVVFKTDLEARALLERGRVEAELKSLEYRTTRKGEKK